MASIDNKLIAEKQKELDTALKEYKTYHSSFINQQKKIHQLFHSPEQTLHQNITHDYLCSVTKELETIRSQAKKRAKDPIKQSYFSWLKKQIAEINIKTKYFALVYTDVGKFIEKYNIEPPTTFASRKEETLVEPSVIPMNISQVSSSGRPSIGVPNDVFEDGTLDDFLNRSGRSVSIKRKLDNSSVEASSFGDSSFHRIKEHYVNEPYVTVSSTKLQEDPLNLDITQNLNSLELEPIDNQLLEDVEAPNISLDFNMSAALSAYENKLAKEKEAWLKYTHDIGKSEYKLSLVEQCVVIVWELKMKAGYIPELSALSWEKSMEKYRASKIFEENSGRQELYNSEWIAMLGDVMFLGARLFPENKAKIASIDEELEKDMLFYVCKKYIVDKCVSKRVEHTSKHKDWDTDSIRRFAYELILESCEYSGQICE